MTWDNIGFFSAGVIITFVCLAIWAYRAMSPFDPIDMFDIENKH